MLAITMAAPMASPHPRTRLLNGVIAYAAAAVIQRAIGFLLLPVYARVLTPAEYGQIGVLMTIAAAVGTVLSLGLETAVFRGYVRLGDRPAELRRFVNTVGTFAIVVPLLVAVPAGIGLSSTFQSAFGVPGPAVALGFMGAALLTSATVVPLAILRAQERLRDYVRLTGVQVVLTVGLTFTLVVILRWGVIGWMLAFAAASAALLIRGVLLLNHAWSREMEARHLVAAIAFGLPMIPHALAHWGLSLSDRVILAMYLDPAAVGVYYVAYLFGLPISLLAVGLSQAVQPLYARASVADGRNRELSRSVSHQALACILATMVVAILGPPAVRAFLPSAYAPAASFVPWIALGHGLYALYFIPMNVITVLSGKNRWVWVVTVIAALLNVGLNVVLVPRIGATAAAINTVVGYAILVVGVSIYMFRVVDRPLTFEWPRIILSLTIAIAATVVAMLFTPEDPVLQLISRGGLVALVIGLFAVVRLINWRSALARMTESR